jgi:hypothetical protein
MLKLEISEMIKLKTWKNPEKRFCLKILYVFKKKQHDSTSSRSLISGLSTKRPTSTLNDIICYYSLSLAPFDECEK